ncbi:glycosyltransferase family 39 protein [Halanaeroarchaeum sp. HSR-CO]|uniref:ArnT family glycosyltransferase n=1 Tax=Halanaeroarchaeum sp. HSR-CO TaxID=2866382 RepID=UPI00217D83F7|nr:glycosyltransferase family 39 protein [Halanaeroarchaeum sp. HSR-CO]
MNHDEGVYLQQAAMLLEGQLHLWPPVEGIFRPWFFVEDGGRLYPKYTPVPAAMFAVGELLGGYRLALVGIAAANLALVVGVVREVFEPPTGLLAGAFVLVSPLFLIDSSVFLPYAPTTMLNLLFAYGYLRADRTGERRWAVASGAAVGLAFFARPYTAVLFAAPFVLHALWTLAVDWSAAVTRQVIVASLGVVGVATALAYNAMMTGSPWVFPYQAFGPLDGPGFGHRQLLAHEVTYTPELAVEANRAVVELFFTEWIAGGVFGVAFALVGLVQMSRRPRSPREILLAGLFVSVIVGNVFFWGNLNLLGDIDRAGDGLVAAFGPYYHFDLLLPTAAFAAAGAERLAGTSWRRLASRLDRRLARTAFVLVLFVSAGLVGTVTASDLNERLEENLDVTETYEVAYEPLEDGPPENSVVLVPDPYGNWLNHPFQPLRNEPGFDGPTVYAIDDRPFSVADEYPDRRMYRYRYRGAWAPYAGSPEAAHLQRVRDVSGAVIRHEATLGIPDGAVGVTARIETDGGSAYYVAPGTADSLDFDLVIEDGRVSATGDLQALDNGSVVVDGRDTVRATVFVDYGPSGGFEYRMALPVDASDDEVRALSPRIEHCREVRTCGGEAAYIPEVASDGVFVRSTLGVHNPNS